MIAVKVRRFAIVALCCALFASLHSPASAARDRVTLQLKWYPLFQSAGYYTALDKGFFGAAGLDVTIKPGGPMVQPTKEVEQGHADFGVSGVDLLSDRSHGKPFVSLAAIFQHSAAGIMVRADSPIHSLVDLVGKRVAMSPGSMDEMELRAALKAEGANPARVHFVPLRPGLDRLESGQVDAQNVYITNEPYLAQETGIPVRTLRAIDSGVDFYGDCLFTTDQMIRRNPDMVNRFRRAVLLGWDYAFDHPDEAIDILMRRQDETPVLLARDHLRYEADHMRPLVMPDIVRIGNQNPERWRHIQDLLQQQGLIDHPVDLDRFVWKDPAIAAQEWRSRVFFYVITALAAALLLLAVYYWWNRQLKLSVRRQSAELESARQDLELRGRALHSLLEMGYTLAGEMSQEGLITQVIRQVKSGLGFAKVSVYLVDRAKRELRGTTGVTVDDNVVDFRPTVAPLDAPEEAAQVARGDLDQYLGDGAESGVEDRGGERGIVPLKAGGVLLGALAVEDTPDAHPLTDGVIRQLRGFADEIALALYNAQLLHEAEEHRARLERSNRDLRALLNFSRAANSAGTTDEVVRLIVDTVRQGYGFDRAGVFLVENGVARGILGTDEQSITVELHGRDWRLPEPDQQPEWRALLAGEQDYIYDPDFTAHTGVHTESGKPVRHHVQLTLRAHGRIIGMVAIDNAITHRPFTETEVQPLVPFARHAATALENVRLLDALRTSEERLWELVASLSEAIYSLRIQDDRFALTFVSPQIERVTGYTAEEAMAQHTFWDELVYPDDRPRFEDSFEKVRQGRAIAVEYRIVHRSGEVRWVLDSPVPLFDEAGRVVGANGTVLDMTERKQLEEQLQQAQKMESVGTLAGGIAHDFNNLLAIINGNIELAQMDLEEDSPANHSLAQTRKAVQRAADLTQQLLTFSRKTATAREQVSLNSIIEETVPLVQPSLGKGIALDVKTDPDVGPVEADPGQMQQVLINLCVNARDAMPGGGRLIIRTQNVRVRESDISRPANLPAGDYVRMQVRDTGGGMDAATRERVFEPFFTTKPMGRGTGLGLAVAYAIVSDHHGWIDVESTPGEGTLFSVYLPAVSQEQPAREVPAPDVPATILIVDSDALARENLAGILERRGYTALTAADSSEALALYWTEEDRVSLVVCAANLTDMDYTQLIRHMHDYNPDVTVLLACDQAQAAQVSLENDMPIVGILPKPYREESALDHVRTALRLQRAPAV